MRAANRSCCWACVLGSVLATHPFGVRAQEANVAQADEENQTAQAIDDDDITRPVRTFDIRYHFENDSTETRNDKQEMILRRNFKEDFIPDWQLGLRADLPITFSNVMSAGNPDGDYQSGLGRLLFLGYVGHALDDRQALGLGDEIMAPAASGKAFGSGNWDMLPLGGYRYMLPEISPGSYFLAEFRYSFTFAQSFAATPTSNLQFSPELRIALPDNWFVILFPSTDIRYNFGAQVKGQTGRLFLPLDGEIGRSIGDRFVTSLELSAPVIDDYPVYRLKIELRLSYQLGS
jgi:hypothetical protein